MDLSDGYRHRSVFSYFALLALLSGVYFALSLFGTWLNPLSDFPILVWPATGSGLAILLVLGKKFWPCIFLGSVAANSMVGVPILAAIGIGIGNTLEGVIAAALIGLTSFDKKLDKVSDLLLLGVYGIFLSAPIGATIGVVSLVWGGAFPAPLFTTMWLAWYLGDVVRLLVVTPLILVWWYALPLARVPRSFAQVFAIEVAGLALLTAYAGYVAFWNGWQVPPDVAPLLLYPALLPGLWAALRFGPRGTVLVTYVIAVFAVSGTVLGKAPFTVHVSGHASDLITLIYMSLHVSSVAIACLILSTSLAEKKRAQGESLMILARLDQASKAKDEFLATLAHELRNPLAPIVSSLQLIRMRGEAVQEGVARSLAIIERQVASLIRLLDDLLDVARIERGKVVLRVERVDICQVARMAVETSKPLIQEYGHDFSLSLPDDPLVVLGDPLRLEQIMTNLLNNAAKYTNPGGAIVLRACRHDSSAEIHVTDTGIGIAPDMLDKIFSGFSQLDRSRRHEYGGLGLGLKLIKSLVELHGGTVRALSGGQGKGSEFVVRLPLARVAA